MECPVCKTKLQMSDKQGIEIDYCPDCRGIWLDRGELDKIIERSNSAEYGSDNINRQFMEGRDKHHDDNHHYPYGNKYGRKKSLLSELFD
jgi:Zn-finger nucleic acid-binding protein